MPTDPEFVTPTEAPVKPPVTRMWIVLQRLTRMRDEFCRDKNPAGKVETARAMAERAAELKALADEVLREAESAATLPAEPSAE